MSVGKAKIFCDGCGMEVTKKWSFYVNKKMKFKYRILKLWNPSRVSDDETKVYRPLSWFGADRCVEEVDLCENCFHNLCLNLQSDEYRKTDKRD